MKTDLEKKSKCKVLYTNDDIILVEDDVEPGIIDLNTPSMEGPTRKYKLHPLKLDGPSFGHYSWSPITTGIFNELAREWRNSHEERD